MRHLRLKSLRPQYFLIVFIHLGRIIFCHFLMVVKLRLGSLSSQFGRRLPYQRDLISVLAVHLEHPYLLLHPLLVVRRVHRFFLLQGRRCVSLRAFNVSARVKLTQFVVFIENQSLSLVLVLNHEIQYLIIFVLLLIFTIKLRSVNYSKRRRPVHCVRLFGLRSEFWSLLVRNRPFLFRFYFLTRRLSCRCCLVE